LGTNPFLNLFGILGETPPLGNFLTPIGAILISEKKNLPQIYSPLQKFSGLKDPENWGLYYPKNKALRGG